MRLASPMAEIRDDVLGRLAPEGTVRRAWLRASKRLLETCLPKRKSGQVHFKPPVVCAPLDVYNVRVMRSFLKGLPLSVIDASPTDAVDSVQGAARWLLALLRDRPDLRQRFPCALSEGHEGAFAHWLIDTGARQLGLSPQAVEHVQAAFRQCYGERVRRLYDHLPELRELFPLALTPAGRRQFLRLLLIEFKQQQGFLDEEMWWFLHECAEDPGQGIVATYVRTPDWQRRFPNGLTVFGQQELLAWIRSHYRIREDWLNHVVFPPLEPPRDAHRAAGQLQQRGINVLAHFCYPSGLQEAARSMVQALNGAGIQTSCRDIPASLTDDRPCHSDYLGLEQFDTTLIAVAPEPVLDRIYPHSGLAAREAVDRIAVWFWELETVPVEWVKYAEVLHEIWAPTRFIAQALRSVMPIPVIDMLPSAELGEVPALPRSHFGLPEDRFLFLFTFDMCSVMERKNPLGLIHAYQWAFGNDPRVSLVIKVTRGSSDPESLDQLNRAARAAGVLVIDRLLPREEVHALTQACDCYVSLHRSEGFGYTMAEAMLLGKPVIATGYSGNLDFMSPANSLLVDYERVPITRRLPHYPLGCVWAEPNIEHAARLMRWVFEHPVQARALGTRACADAGRLLSPSAAGRRMADRLRERDRNRVVRAA